MRQVAEVLALGKEANIVQLAAALLVSGGVVALAAYVVFDVYRVWPSALNIALFIGGVTVYAVVGWCVARARTIEPLTLLGRVGMMSPVLGVTQRLFVIWLLLWPGRLAGLGAIGAYRFIKARKRLKELIGHRRNRSLEHEENVRL